MLVVSILGSILSDTSKNESAWKKVYAQFKYYASAKECTPHDYNGTIFAAIDLSLDHDENKMFSKDLCGACFKHCHASLGCGCFQAV
jgi:hypothetical protein